MVVVVVVLVVVDVVDVVVAGACTVTGESTIGVVCGGTDVVSFTPPPHEAISDNVASARLVRRIMSVTLQQ